MCRITFYTDAIVTTNNFEMWCFRRMLDAKWIDKITNGESLKIADEKRRFCKNLRKGIYQLIGHVIRHSR